MFAKSKTIPLILLSGLMAQTALAERSYKFPATYPFVPKPTNEIYSDVKRVTEDEKFLKNFLKIVKGGLSRAKTKEKPWTSSYWPMNKGMIADPYEESALPYYLDIGWVAWEQNYSSGMDRLEDLAKKVDTMSEEELAELAPSEKYDLLMGDKNFTLTRKLWLYTKKWGSKKENGFTNTEELPDYIAGEFDYKVYDKNNYKKFSIKRKTVLDLAKQYVNEGYYSTPKEALEKSWLINKSLSAKKTLVLLERGTYRSVEMAFAQALKEAKEEAKNYVLVKKNSRLAAWEGICNGWSTAAGLVPRPRKKVSFTLPNGKKLKFYPADIKGLASLYYVNSLIQGSAKIGSNGLPYTQGTVSAGMRCNLKNAKLDIFGRPYDHEDDQFNAKTHRVRDSRCAGVHPATWHMGLVNLIGKQGRSFVVERKVGAAVDNHPMYKYKMDYYNPNTGSEESHPLSNIVKIDDQDMFKQFRNKKAKYIVGVETEITYMDYARPDRKSTDSEKDDEEVDKKMYYDLELDENYNIVGGQWRAMKVGAPALDSRGKPHRNARLNHNQPDFFWTITKNYKDSGLFSDVKVPTAWKDKSKAPPKSWLKVGLEEAVNFVYELSYNYEVTTCSVRNKRTDKVIKVPCKQEYEKPQPFVNVLNVLIEKAK